LAVDVAIANTRKSKLIGVKSLFVVFEALK